MTSTSKATFGAGCFWGVEARFRKVDGVVDAVSGYIGGTLDDPTYQDICTGKTGHAEVVQVEFDPAKVSFEQLLEIFWDAHNPTTLNRQGPDAGTQYRSAIFFHDKQQQATAITSKENVESSGKHKSKIVTEVSPASKFYRAEEYHQRYLEKNGMDSCSI